MTCSNKFCLKIVYYTTREVKSCVYNFSSYPGRKYYIRISEPGTKVVLSARVWWKILFYHSVRKARFWTCSNKKACPKLSFWHVVSKNCVQYSSEKVIFRHTLPESDTFAPVSKTRMWYFRPGYDEKYYTHQGINWPAHISCLPTISLRCGLTKFFLLGTCNILLSSCGIFILALLRREPHEDKIFRTCIKNNYLNDLPSKLHFSYCFIT